MNGYHDWRISTSNVARNTFNPIRAIVDGMKLTPNPEKVMIPLSIGDPSTFGNLLPPAFAIDGVIEGVKSTKFNGYAPSAGYKESREAVGRYLTKNGSETKFEDVFIVSGCSSALDLAISALLNPGENLLIPRPGFSLYRTLCLSQGIEVKSYNCLPEKMWEIDLDHLESLIDENTRAIVVVNPSNPCGSNFSAKHVRDIIRVAYANKLPIISDEIYDGMTFKGQKFTSFASQSEHVPILTCGGISKKFLVPGWRLGWVVMHDKHDIFGEEMRRGLMSLTQRTLGACTIIQSILPKLLESEDTEYMDRTMALIQSNSNYAFDAISKMKGLKPVAPQAAFYMMVGISLKDFPKFKNEVEFTEALICEQSVFCLPATCFDYPGYFRIVLTIPEEKVIEACSRMKEFCDMHYVQ